MTDNSSGSPNPSPAPVGTGHTVWRIVLFLAAIAAVVAVLPKGNNPQAQKDDALETSTGNASALSNASNASNASSGGREVARSSRLIVHSTPAGATLLVNGRMIGATPLILEGMAAGCYGLRLEKAGCQPALLNVSVGAGAADAVVEQKLAPAPSGALEVDVEPEGCEVLLDGEIAGTTPLRLASVTVGSHELLIRKTNREPYMRQIEVAAGETLTFADFELKDQVLAMMKQMVEAEPQRLAHYIDLAHYLFIENKLGESADTFAQGMEVMKTPLDFDGPGYAGKDKMNAAEIQLEQRLRREDQTRFDRELKKHRNWPRVDTRVFRQKLDEALELISRKNIALWIWADRAARTFIQSKNYERAARLYQDHIAATPKDSPDLFRAYSALAEVYLYQHDVGKLSSLFDKFFPQFSKDSNALLAFGKTVYPFHDRVVGKDNRAEVLRIAEKALQQAFDGTKDKRLKAAVELELANVLVLQDKPDAAIPHFEQAVAAARDTRTREDCQLRLADALRRAGKFDAARKLFQTLAGSSRSSVQSASRVGLEYISTQQKLRQEQPKQEKDQEQEKK